MMPRVLVAVGTCVVMVTFLGFLVTRGWLAPLPWMPIFWIAMFVFAVIVLRVKRPISGFAETKLSWVFWVGVAWAFVCLAGAIQGLLFLVSGRGNETTVWATLGATTSGGFLVFILRSLYKKNRHDRPRTGSTDTTV